MPRLCLSNGSKTDYLGQGWGTGREGILDPNLHTVNQSPCGLLKLHILPTFLYAPTVSKPLHW